MSWFTAVMNYLFGAPQMSEPASSAALARGIRNNNPGNIDRDGTEWEGMSPDQSSDPRFVVFSTAEYGIRALVKILQSYQREGFTTIDAMIARWAPSTENDTSSYQKFVVSRVGVSGDLAIDIADPQLCYGIVAAIIAQENADYAYPSAVLQAGIALATD